ncbi:putative sulfate/molybdate transporter [Haloarculaceae archaeon H-GB2-1]|nr:putative sulfate/molybdate transporter [Haloarculaceae archaeon H-GB11]MEA5407418.1 putative sulfate/molybdate transporter [Haloarculaceae archaeon H-GB2-1]
MGDLQSAALGVVTALVVTALGYRRGSALAVVGLGTVLALFTTGVPTPSVPAVEISVPSSAALLAVRTGEATLAQLAMTVGNAAVATSLLLDDYFDADVSADELATSMGAMNLLAVPLGAIPMCHGSGGVAGKHAFGARTATANVVLGVLYALVALLAVEVLASFPMAMLGAVLALVAIELGRTAVQTDALGLTMGVAVVGLGTNLGVAFVGGVLVWVIRERVTDGGGVSDAEEPS